MTHDHPGWEYRLFEPIGTLTIDALNTLGAEGWELIAIYHGNQMILKRRRPELREIVTADQRAHVFGEPTADGGAT
jgi:hypothetical protein